MPAKNIKITNSAQKFISKNGGQVRLFLQRRCSGGCATKNMCYLVPAVSIGFPNEKELLEYTEESYNGLTLWVHNLVEPVNIAKDICIDKYAVLFFFSPFLAVKGIKSYANVPCNNQN